jgi:Domain of unknown function (DUF4252)
MIMKRLLPIAVSVVLLAGTSVRTQAQEAPPGQVDFGVFTPPGAGQIFVEVNVPESLISIAASVVEKQEPDAAKLLRAVKGIHMDVIGLNDENRNQIEQRARRLREEVSKKGWERIVVVQQKEQNIGVYLKMDSKSVIQGLTIVVLDGQKQAVFANIVGDIKPEQIAMLAERLRLDPLKQLGKELGPLTSKPDGGHGSHSSKAPESESEP